jgi:mannose-6-phosphate isomerase-like protein (cupin superfamily)
MNCLRPALLSLALACSTITVASAADVTFLNDAQLLQALRSARSETGDASGMYAVPLPSESKSVVWGIRRTKPTAAEIHEAFDDVWYVLEGAGTLVTGGTVVDATTASPGEIRGPSVKGGETRRVQKGDFVYIPAGTPHWISAVDGPELLYTVVKVPARAD